MRSPSSLYDHPFDYMAELASEITRIRKALEALAEEPGNPHHAAGEALKILNQED